MILSWRNVSLTLRKTKNCKRQQAQQILQNVSGFVKSGEVTAVMGPSGAGKTSLLDVIAGKSKIKYRGEVLCNGSQNGTAALIGYVPQDERSIVSALTVRDNLMYSARLRLPSSSDDQRSEQVDEIICLIGLQDVADSVVGNETRRGISGGQKKRLAIGIELVARPTILLLDEPTTGLDSAAAYQIMTLISSTAKSLNIAVLATIHQPSRHTFNLFDRVLLLAKGQTVYFGPTNKMQEYFENELKKPLPMNVSPPDHYIDTVNTDFDTVSDLDRITSYWSMNREFTVIDEINTLNEKAMASDMPVHKTYQSNAVSQACWLVHRSMKIIQRDYISYMIRIISVAVGAILMGSLWYKLPNDTDHLRAYYGIAYNVALINAFSLIASIPDMLTERIRFSHEHSNGYYRVFSWFFATNIMSTLYLLAVSLCFSAIAFFMVGFTMSVERFFIFEAIVLLLLLCGEALLQMISVLVPLSSIATTLGLVVAGLSGALSGVFIRFNNMPVYWVWAKWLSFFHYGVNALMLNQYQGTDVICVPSKLRPCPSVNADQAAVISGDELIEQLDLTFTDIGYPLYCLIAYFFVHKTVTLIALYASTKQNKNSAK